MSTKAHGRVILKSNVHVKQADEQCLIRPLGPHTANIQSEYNAPLPTKRVAIKFTGMENADARNAAVREFMMHRQLLIRCYRI